MSWETEEPKLSRCFRQIALIDLPCLILWVTLPIEAINIARSKFRLIPWNFLNIGRLFLVGLCIALGLWEFVFALSRGSDAPPSDFYSPLLRVVTFVSGYYIGFLLYTSY